MEIELKYAIEDAFIIDKIFNDNQVVAIKDANTEEQIPMEAVFYDTADQKLRRSGYAFRIRKEGEAYVATLKWGGAFEGGMHKRQEMNIMLGTDREKNVPDVSVFCIDESVADLKELIGEDELVPMMEVSYLRRQVRIDTGKSISVLSADEGYVRAAGKESPILELEIELYSGSEDDMREFGDIIATRYNLIPENTSKFKRGLNLLKEV